MKNYLIKDLLAVLLCLICAYVIWLKINPYGSALTPDSLNYLEIARNIADGNGLSTANRVFEAEQKFIPSTVWPPLYPYLLSWFVSDDFSQGPYASANLALILLAGFALSIYWLFRGIYKSSLVGLLAAVVMIVSLPVVTVYTYAWSETVFCLLVVLTILSTVSILDGSYTSSTSWSYMALAISLIGLFYTRYIGIVFLISFLLLLIFKWKNLSKVWFALSTSVCVLAYAGLMLRNYLLAGSISGAERGVGRSASVLGEQLLSTLQVFSTPLLLLIALMAGVLLNLLALNYKNSIQISLNLIKCRWLVVVSLTFAVIYLLGLIAMAATSTFDSLDIRLTAPFWLCISLAAIAGLGLGLYSGKYIINFLSVFLLVCLAGHGVQKIWKIETDWKNTGLPMLAQSANGYYNNFNNLELANFLQKTLKQKDIQYRMIIAEAPAVYELWFNIPSVSLPKGVINADWINSVKAHPNSLLVLQGRAQELADFVQQHPDIQLSFYPELAQANLMVIDVEQGLKLP